MPTEKGNPTSEDMDERIVLPDWFWKATEGMTTTERFEYLVSRISPAPRTETDS